MRFIETPLAGVWAIELEELGDGFSSIGGVGG
jgi:hypothetical protein